MSFKTHLPSYFEVQGQRIPSVGLGTFQSGAGNTLVKQTVLAALKSGYRHIDTAAAYGNEREIGEAIKESGVPREEIFLTTKLPSDVEEALNKSLEALQSEYVDLYLMHFPYAYMAGTGHSTIRHPDGKPIMDLALSRGYPQTWAAMEALVDKGTVKMIGISNFNMLKIKRVLEHARIKPAVLQVELHPYLPQSELLQYAKQEGIHVMAHQPLGGRPIAAINPNQDRPGPMADPEVEQIAQAYNKSVAQILLSWAVQRGTSIVPKTVHEARLLENKDIFVLRHEHFDRFNRLAEEKGTVRYLDPKEYVGFDIFDEGLDQPFENS